MSVCGDHMTQPPRSNPQEFNYSHANSVTHAVQCGLETTLFNFIVMYTCMHAYACTDVEGGGGGHVTYCELHRYDCVYTYIWGSHDTTSS